MAYKTIHHVGQHEPGTIVEADQLGGEDNIPRLIGLGAIAPIEGQAAPKAAKAEIEQLKTASAKADEAAKAEVEKPKA